MITVNRASNAPLISFYVGTGGVAKGQLCMVSSGTAIDATEGQSTAVIIGVAFADYDAGEVGYFYPLANDTFEIDVYQGGSTDDVTDAMIGVAYDLYVDSGDHLLDLNDTTGAMFVVQAYDNVTNKATCKIINSLLYLA